MNRLVDTMTRMKMHGEKALIPYLTIGDPQLEQTAVLMRILAQSGADVIELGMPFSDPLADGPVLQEAAQRALQTPICLDHVCSLLKDFRKDYTTPVVLLVYYNLIYHAGLMNFCQKIAEAGADALVVPDLPYEESSTLEIAAASFKLINIRFLSPTTTKTRLHDICSSAQGFIYCVAVSGVTGEQRQIEPALLTLLAEARRITNVPLALGFGISTPNQAAQAALAADAVIVGSALVKKIAEAVVTDEKYQTAGQFVRNLKDALQKTKAEGLNNVTAATD